MKSPGISDHPSHHDRPGHGPASEHDADLAELLDLDALLGAEVLNAALDAATDPLSAAPHTVVDLGAGTGTGTVALATRFAGAQVHAVDASSAMLDRVNAAALIAGVADRVETHLADIDGDWPAVVPGGVDVAWAALSLHHTTEPERVLRQVFDVLRPGGVLVVTEFAGSTAYDPADLGTARDGLGDRVVRALAERGYPVSAEWTTALAAAGFTGVVRRELPVVISALSTSGARYLALHLARNRELLSGDLAVDDLAALDDVIDALSSGAVDLELTSGRVFWVAVRPGPVEPEPVEMEPAETEPAEPEPVEPEPVEPEPVEPEPAEPEPVETQPADPALPENGAGR